MQSDIGLIGLAVMGQNLALNIADHGFAISVYNRTTAKTDEFVKENPKTPGKLTGCPTMKDFAASLKKPRKAVILVKAGGPVQVRYRTFWRLTRSSLETTSSSRM